MRTRFFVNVYVGGFYLENKVSTAQAAIDAQGAKRVIFVMMRAADAEQFVESIDDGLRANNTPEELLLRIWFGDNPAQEELKRALLGQQL